MIKLESGTTAYNTKEVAELLHRTVNTIRRYVKSGKLKAQKVGNEWFITGRTLEEFLTGEKPER